MQGTVDNQTKMASAAPESSASQVSIELAVVELEEHKTTNEDSNHQQNRPTVLPATKSPPIKGGKTFSSQGHQRTTSEQSMHNMHLRHIEMMEKKQSIKDSLSKRDSRCWTRKFYCTDYCRIRALLFLSDSDSSSGAFAYWIMLIVVIMISYVMAIMETFRDTAQEAAPYMPDNLYPITYLRLQSVLGTCYLFFFFGSQVYIYKVYTHSLHPLPFSSFLLTFPSS